MIYTQDLPADHTVEELSLTHEHVRAELSARADADDDPETRSEDVVVEHVLLPDGRMRVVGKLEGDPVAPYLEPDYDPLAGVDPALFEAEVAAAQRDQVVLGG